MKSLRGVAPMFPLSMGGLTPQGGRATIERGPLAPTIPAQFWAGVSAGAVRSPDNTPQYAAGTPVPIPGAPVVNTSIGGSTLTLTIGGQKVDITLPGSGGDCCG